MKMPSRADFGGATELFLQELSKFMAVSEASYQHLREMYDATTPFAERPPYDPTYDQKYVWLRQAPADEELEVALRNLSGSVLDKGGRVVRVHHGPAMDGWACFVDIDRAA